MFEPTNEQGVIVLFAQQAQAAGIEIVEIRTQYPDAIIRKDGQDYKAEFEYQSSGFLMHKHDPSECDVIICQFHDWADCPLPIIELNDPNWKQANLRKDLRKLAAWWRAKALSLEASLITANSQISQLEKLVDQSQIPENKKITRINRQADRRGRLSEILRTKPALSQGDLARELGVSLSTVKRDIRAVTSNGHNQ